MSPESDFILRYALESRPPVAGGPDTLLDLIRDELQSLLEIVVLTHEGKPIAVDGFATTMEPERIHELRPSDHFQQLLARTESEDASQDTLR